MQVRPTIQKSIKCPILNNLHTRTRKMEFPKNPCRASIRWKYHDYSVPGYYFITLCSYQRKCSFGEIRNGCILPTETGRNILAQWCSLQNRYTRVLCDEAVLMPNHFHGLLYFNYALSSECPLTLGVVVASLKAHVTREARSKSGDSALQIWQRNYWDRYVRNERELDEIRTYIRNNPLQWELDRLNPDYRNN